MMNAVQQEMQHKERRLIRQQFIDVEEEPMEKVFQHGPDNIAGEEAEKGFRKCIRGKIE